MNVCGIICEYNPFHNGHAYHIQKAREITECDVLVCVMSGNFVQRGEPAICDKWKRAETAIRNGCDLVVELPYPFILQRGDRFAHGAMEVLKQVGIDSLVFGSECGDIKQLQHIAKQDVDLKEHHIDGISYAKALEHSLNTPLPSNDMLGLFYIKEIANTNIKPFCIKRTNEYHDDSIEQSISSASAIRAALKQHKDIHHTTPMQVETLDGYSLEAYYPYLQTLLLTSHKEHLCSLFLMDEGIESLLIKQAKIHADFEAFLNGCVSKRYTRSSIQRTLIHLLTQTTKMEINQLDEPTYIRVLSYNSKGQSYLRHLRKQGKHVVSTFKDIPDAYRILELRSTQAYAFPYPLEKRKEIVERERMPAVRVL